MNPIEKYAQRVSHSRSLLCVGLDSDLKYIPRQFRDEPFPQFAFNAWIIQQTHNYVSAYKPNIAFYEARGERGLSELKMTVDFLHERYPEIIAICDARRSDSNQVTPSYVEGIFDWFGFDAITLSPYEGRQALQPFLDRVDKASIIICRTANPTAKDLQDWDVGGRPLWQMLVERVATEWNENQNCMIVVGATLPTDIKKARELVGDMPILIPGISMHGNALKRVVENGVNSSGGSLVLSSSRSIIFADDPGPTARRLRDEINQYRTPSA